MISGTLISQHRYDFKSGMIKYRIEGNISGTEVIFFDDFGNLYYDCKQTTTETGKKQTELYIEKNDSVFIYNSNQNKPVVKTISQNNHSVAKNRVADSMLKEMGFEYIGKEKAGDVLCDKYVSDNTVLWIWNHIIIKSQVEVMNVILKKEAVKIETGNNMPAGRFQFSVKNIYSSN